MFPYTFPVPPLNKGTLNPPKITEPSAEGSAEQGTFGRSLQLRIIFLFPRQMYVKMNNSYRNYNFQKLGNKAKEVNNFKNSD